MTNLLIIYIYWITVKKKSRHIVDISLCLFFLDGFEKSKPSIVTRQIIVPTYCSFAAN